MKKNRKYLILGIISGIIFLPIISGAVILKFFRPILCTKNRVSNSYLGNYQICKEDMQCNTIKDEKKCAENPTCDWQSCPEFGDFKGYCGSNRTGIPC